MARLSLPHVGSFQEGHRIVTENPLEEVWSHIARLGITRYVRDSLASTMTATAPPPWDDWGPYATIRMRQAVEFWKASRSGSLLTRPLALYYSFLNLTRGMFALEELKQSARGHGLHFEEAAYLLDCGATPTSSGTFADYLGAHGLVKVTETLTLRDCLARIPEIGDEFLALREGPITWRSVFVRASMDGEVLLQIFSPDAPAEFRHSWANWFPGLADACTLEPEGTVLRVTPGEDTKTYETIGTFLNAKLWTRLLWSSDPRWYAPIMGTVTALPRPAYYFLATYILGNVVRYAPELLADLTDPDSHLGWTIQRFLNTAERFYPQLMFHWAFTTKVFF